MSKSYKDIKAILFDFGGTVDSDGLNWKDRFYPVYRRFGVRWPKEEYDRYFYFADDTLVERKLSKQNFKETLHLQVSLVLKKGGIFSARLKDKIANQFLKDSIKMIQRNTHLFKRLSIRYQLGFVSNFYGNLETLCEELNLTRYFGAIADSVRVGALKPSPKIFRYVLNEFNCKPSQALFVGDSLTRDMMGAKKLGMAHIWLRHKNYEEMKPCCRGDKIITSLTQLEKILL